MFEFIFMFELYLLSKWDIPDFIVAKLKPSQSKPELEHYYPFSTRPPGRPPGRPTARQKKFEGLILEGSNLAQS